MIVVFGMDEFVAKWVSHRIPVFSPTPGHYSAIGFADGSRLIAGAVYHDFNEIGIGLTMAADDPKWCTRTNLCAIFRYPFEQLKVRRVTACAARKNKRSRKLIEGVGFKLEGVIREGMGNQDAMLYGMLKKECKWLQFSERVIHGQEIIQSAGRS